MFACIPGVTGDSHDRMTQVNPEIAPVDQSQQSRSCATQSAWHAGDRLLKLETAMCSLSHRQAPDVRRASASFGLIHGDHIAIKTAAQTPYLHL